MNDTAITMRGVPSWVPVDVRNYVFHTEMGQPIRSLARSQSCHASTIMRQIRKIETRRDDPLVDRAIKSLSNPEGPNLPSKLEMMQVLRRLAVPDAILAIAVGMEQGVILQNAASGEIDHGSKLPAETAMFLALRGWIASGKSLGKVLRYRITTTGRVALRELVAETENQARAFAEKSAEFTNAPEGVGQWEETTEVVRLAHQETPVQALSRRRDADGAPFLSRALVRSAERLREDFEIAQINTHQKTGCMPNWQTVLAAIESHVDPEPAQDPAVDQVNKALVYLGPGLAEIALRCCCLLEGLEITEKSMGWAARSGKVVLRIALQRLQLHYEATGQLGPKIG